MGDQPAGQTLVFESYDDVNYGYLRLMVTPAQLRIEYHPASDGASTKTPDDSVTIDLASGTLVHYEPAPAPGASGEPDKRHRKPKRGKKDRS